MIDVKELRIGNWISSYMFLDARPVHYGPKEIRKVQVDIELLKFLSENPLATYDYIPLTPELLIQCGFDPETDDDWANLKIDPNDLWLRWMDGSIWIGDWDTRAKHLHQLQNLFISLTQNELQINWPTKQD